MQPHPQAPCTVWRRNCSFIRWKPEFLRLETVISHKPQWIKIPNFAFSNQEGTGLVSKDSHAGA